MVKLKQHEKAAALYCRLSRDDEFNSESLSIQNQKTMLSQYAKEKGLINFSFYVDDGFTGTNFDRPDFKRMIGDIEDGKIGTVIVKDLSRLGREYLQTGYYTEIFFPQNDVRFIAVNDNVDSENGENEFAPFKNIINEFYAKDISRKVKSAFRTRAMNGGICLGTNPYGYEKVEGSTNRLKPDVNAATVKKMFAYALEGRNCYWISKRLEAEKILTPKAYKMKISGKENAASYPKHPYSWSKQSVYEILSNPIYTGNLYCLKYMTKSFKDKRIVERPEDEWIVISNTHEPLVSENDFETVKQRISVKQSFVNENPDNIFRGLLYCSGCNTRLAFQHRVDNHKSKGCYRCARHIRYGKGECSSHYITIEQVEAVVLNDIQRHVKLAAENAEKYADYLKGISERDKNGEMISCKRNFEKAKKRSSEIDILLQKLYEDKVFGVISEERYIAMSASMESEQQELKQKIVEYNDFLGNHEKKSQNVGEFIRLVRNYEHINELTAELVHTLIEKIVIHEREKTDNDVIMRIDIYYRFIGNACDDGESLNVPDLKRKNL